MNKLLRLGMWTGYCATVSAGVVFYLSERTKRKEAELFTPNLTDRLIMAATHAQILIEQTLSESMTRSQEKEVVLDALASGAFQNALTLSDGRVDHRDSDRLYSELQARVFGK